MTRQDWIDYFEAIKGRRPSPEEINQALLAGDFVDEQGPQVIAGQGQPARVEVEAAPVQAAPVSPVQPSVATQAIYQNQEPSGLPVNISHGQPSNGQQVYNVRVAVPTAYTSFLSQFWTWLVSAWKAPNSGQVSHPRNGYLAIGLLTLFASLNAFVISNKAVNFANGAINSFNATVYDTGYSLGLGFGDYFKFFLAFAMLFSALVISGFAVRKEVYKEQSLTLAQTFDRYGRLLSLNILLFAVSAFLLFLNIFGLAGIILMVNLVIFGAASTFAIANFENANPLDKFYQYLLALLLNAVILGVSMLLISAVVGDMFMGSLF